MSVLRLNSLRAISRMFHTIGGSSSPSHKNLRWMEPSNLEDIKTQFRTFEGGLVTLTRDESDGLAYICIDNETKRNGISGKMMVELNEIVTELEEWNDGKGLILYSTGDIFCSGADLDVVKKIGAPEDGFRMACLMHDTVIRLRNLPMVSVAVVQGMAIGGGAELLLCTDFRLFTPETKVCYVQSKMGITTGWGGGTFLKQLVGYQKALEIFLTARKIKAEEALAVGLADGTVSHNRRLEEANVWLKAKIGSHAAAVCRAVKRNALCDGFEEERQILGSVWGGAAQMDKLSQDLKHK